MEISFPENRGVVNLRAAESHGKSREVLIENLEIRLRGKLRVVFLHRARCPRRG